MYPGLPDPQIGRDLEVLEVEGRDLLERGRRDEAAVDPPVRLVDGDEHEQPRIRAGTIPTKVATYAPGM